MCDWGMLKPQVVSALKKPTQEEDIGFGTISQLRRKNHTLIFWFLATYFTQFWLKYQQLLNCCKHMTFTKKIKSSLFQKDLEYLTWWIYCIQLISAILNGRKAVQM